ncbi:phage tail protein [Pedobacter sp. NJ-S-72]
MADGGITFPINFITNGDPVFVNIKKGLNTIEQTIKKTTKAMVDFQDSFSLTKLTTDLNTASDSFKTLGKSFSDAMKAGKDILSATRVQSGPLKADGTADMRFRVNQIAAQSQGITGYFGNAIDRLGLFINKMGTVTSNVGNVMGTMGQVSGSMGELSTNLGSTMGDVGDLMGRLGTSMESIGGVTGTIGRVVGNIGGYTSTIGDTLGGVGEVMDTLSKGMGSVGGLVDGIGKNMGTLGTVISSVGSGIKNIIPALSGVGTAIMSIPGIGWIIAAIAAVVVAVKLLWDNSQRFREILFSIWEVAQAVFYNIGVVINRVWELVIKPVAALIREVYSGVFTAIGDFIQTVWNGISTGLQWLWSSVIQPVATFIWELYTGIFLGIWNVIKTVFTAILGFASGIWNWIIKTFSGFGKWINNLLIKPIREAFSGIWKWISDLFDGIMNKIMKFIKPIKDLWNKIFSSDGMKDLKVAAQVGKEKGAKSFQDDQKDKAGESKNEKSGKNSPKETMLAISSFNLKTTPALPTMSPIGGVAATQVMSTAGPDKGGATQNTGNLNITKLIENLNIYNQNGTTMSKESMVTMVKDALLTAVADFSLVKAQ